MQGRMIRGEERLLGLSGPGGYKDPRNERLLSLSLRLPPSPSSLLLPLSRSHSSAVPPPHRPELAAICGDGGPGTQRKSGSAPSALRHPPLPLRPSPPPVITAPSDLTAALLAGGGSGGGGGRRPR